MATGEFLMVEGLVGILTVAFVAWAGVVWRATRALLEQLQETRREFHEYHIMFEHRLTQLETVDARLGDIIRKVMESADG